jgi:hypothetical protein
MSEPCELIVKALANQMEGNTLTTHNGITAQIKYTI